MVDLVIPFLDYGIFRLDNPSVDVQNGMARPKPHAPRAGTLSLSFDGVNATHDAHFQNDSAFQVEAEGKGYRVVNPGPGLLTLSGAEVKGAQPRYAYSLTLGDLTPTGILLPELNLGIGATPTYSNLLEFGVGQIQRAEYAIYPPPRSSVRQLVYVPSSQSWQLRCSLDAGQHGEQYLWCQTSGLRFWMPEGPVGVIAIGGQHRSGVTLEISAGDQPNGAYCGYATIEQFKDFGEGDDPHNPVPLRMYAVETSITPSGLSAKAVHWKLYHAGIQHVGTIEEIPSSYRDDPPDDPSDDAPPGYSIRAIQSAIWMTLTGRNWSSGFAFDGEIRPFLLFDRSNAGIRLFGKAIRCDETGSNEISVSGTASPRRTLVRDVIAQYATIPDAVEQDLAIHGLAFGDFTLVVGRAPHQLAQEEFVTFGSASGWKFPVCQIRKSPLKGDATGADTEFVTGFDPRTEVYHPANGHPSVPFIFGWNDQTCHKDFFLGFVVANDAVGSLQPENSSIRFGAATVATYLPSAANSDFAYKSIEATLLFPAAPANVSERIHGVGNLSSAPAIAWKESFGGAQRPDSELRRVWDSGVTASGTFRRNYVSFIANNSKGRAGDPFQMALPYGWGVRFDPNPANAKDRVVAVFHAIRQSTAQPALEEDTSGPTRRFRIRTDAGEVEKPLPKNFWFPNGANVDLVFPKGTAQRGTEVASPLDPNWSGFVSSNGTVVPPAGLPDSLGDLIKTLKFSYVAWDGQGVTAICNPDPADLPNTAQLRVKSFVLVIHRSQIEQFSMQFEWLLPFFNKPSNFLTFYGRWEKTGSGGDIVFKAGSIGDEITGLFNSTCSLRFSDIELVTSNQRTTIRLRGALLMETAAIATWFDSSIPSIAFRNLEFDFDHPPAPDGPLEILNLPLDTEITLFPKGFRYQLTAIGLKITADAPGTRQVILSGALRYATPGAAFPANPDFAVDLPFNFSSSGLTIGPDPKFRVSGVSVNIFGFFTLGFTDLKFTANQISGTVSVKEAWGDGKDAGLTGTFNFGTASDWSRNKFWLVYLQNRGEFKVGPVTATNAGLLLGHNLSRPGQEGTDFRNKLIGADLKELETYLSNPNGWSFSDEFPWLAGLWFDNLKAGGLPPAFLSGGEGILVLSDSGLFRARFPISMMSIPFYAVDLGVDWRRSAIAASITLTDLNYGSYRLDAGTVSFLVSPQQFMASWGFPFGGDWGRAVKLRWEPPVYLINAVDGGVMLSYGQTIETGVALRVGYQDTIGSDNGMFGAYIRGEIMLGGTVSMAVTTGHETELTHTGTIDLHIEAAGGLVIAGIRWEILRVFVDTGVGFTLVIGRNYVRANYNAHFSAGYEVCPTPCTCVHGSVSFTYGLTAQTGSSYSWNPDYVPPSQLDALNKQRNGDAVVELLREDFR